MHEHRRSFGTTICNCACCLEKVNESAMEAEPRLKVTLPNLVDDRVIEGGFK